ncbi:MAG: DUF368 domain-containing protein [Natronomonas sp.]
MSPTDATGIRGWVVVFLKGACMGIADAVPGVSGGTIALIVGIYDRLITALTAVDPRILFDVGKIRTTNGRRVLAEELVAMDLPFLLLLGVGIVSAAGTVATTANVAVTTAPVPTYAFFFGLIAASGFVLSRSVVVGTVRRLAVGVVGFGTAFFVTGFTASGGGAQPTSAVLFLVGAVVISAMVLPGISGAFLLLLFGQYEFISGLPRAVVSGALTGDPSALEPALGPLFAFLAGAVVGLFSFAYLVRSALRRHRDATLVFLLSLMIGSLRLPVERVAADAGGLSPSTAALVAIPAFLGCAVVLLLDSYTDELVY